MSLIVGFCVFCQMATSIKEDKSIYMSIANIRWIIKKAREFQKNIYFCFIGYAKAFDCGKFERDGNTRLPDCLLRNLYAGQEATVRTGHGTTDWFQIGKGVRQGCILSQGDRVTI